MRWRERQMLSRIPMKNEGGSGQIKKSICRAGATLGSGVVQRAVASRNKQQPSPDLSVRGASVLWSHCLGRCLTGDLCVMFTSLRSDDSIYKTVSTFRFSFRCAAHLLRATSNSHVISPIEICAIIGICKGIVAEAHLCQSVSCLPVEWKNIHSHSWRAHKHLPGSGRSLT
jgi:hypothetical protein